MGVVPKAFQPSGSWKLLATGFLARFADQLRSMAILIQAHHNADSALLLRGVFESVVMFVGLPLIQIRESRNGSITRTGAGSLLLRRRMSSSRFPLRRTLTLIRCKSLSG